MNFKDFIVSEEDMAPMGDPMGGGDPMGMAGGDPMMGGMGGAPPMDPMMGGMGGAPPMDPMGGMGGGAAPGGIQPPIQFKPNSVWDVLEKILNGEPVNDKEDEEKEEKEKEVDQSGQENLNMLSSPQQQEPGMAPTGQVENPQP